MGDGMAVVAFSLLALQLTSNALFIAGVAIASKLPWLTVALPAGAVVDRVNRRRLVVAVELIRAGVLSLLALGALRHNLKLPELYVGVFLIGCGETVVSAASRASIPLIVEFDAVAGANGSISAADTFGASFAGPALGGFAFSIAAAIPFASDALSYFVSASLLGRAIPRTQHPIRVSVAQISADIKSGVRNFLTTPLLRVVTGLIGSFAFCQAIVLAVLVIYATKVLGLGQVGYGVILSIAAIGDVTASLLARRVHARFGPFVAIIGAGGAAAIGYVGLGSTSHRVIAILALAFEAAATAVGNVASLSLRHRTIPTAIFGIVNNAISMCIAGVVLLGALVGGILASAYGTRTTFVLAGLLQLLIAAGLALPLRTQIRLATSKMGSTTEVSSTS